MKKTSMAFILTLPLILTGCTDGISEADLDLARDTCRTAVSEKAKHQGAVQFIEDTIEEDVEPYDTGGVNYEATGDVDFVNGFGVPTRFEFWCHVGAHDGDTGRPEVTVEEK